MIHNGDLVWIPSGTLIYHRNGGSAHMSGYVKLLKGAPKYGVVIDKLDCKEIIADVHHLSLFRDRLLKIRVEDSIIFLDEEQIKKVQ